MSLPKISVDNSILDVLRKDEELSTNLKAAEANDSSNIPNLIYHKFHIGFYEDNFNECLDDLSNELQDLLQKLKEEFQSKILANPELQQHRAHIKQALRIIKELPKSPHEDLELASQIGNLVSLITCIRCQTDIVPLIQRGIYDQDIRRALHFWKGNRFDTKESTWQKQFSKHTPILSRVLGGNVTLLQEQASLNNNDFKGKGGKQTDFLFKHQNTNSAIFVEIKTPSTKLLGRKYRNTYPLSRDLSGSVTQVLLQYSSLMKNFYQKQAGSTANFALDTPKCYIIIGSLDEELKNDNLKKEAFEIQRQALSSSVKIITFDEVYHQFSQFNLIK